AEAGEATAGCGGCAAGGAGMAGGGGIGAVATGSSAAIEPAPPHSTAAARTMPNSPVRRLIVRFRLRALPPPWRRHDGIGAIARRDGAIIRRRRVAIVRRFAPRLDLLALVRRRGVIGRRCAVRGISALAPCFALFALVGPIRRRGVI